MSEIILTPSTTLITNTAPVRPNPILTDHAHQDVSIRYNHVTTAEILDVLRGEGWNVTKQQIQRVRRPDRDGFQKHFVTLRNTNQKLEVGDCELQVRLINSHDGMSSLQLVAGLYRLVCSNGMAISQGQFEAIRIRHTDAEIFQKAIDGARRIVALAPAIDQNIKQMQSVELTPDQRIQFAQDAIKVVWPDRSEQWVNPNDVLQSRRSQDEGADVWHVYNRAQENLIRGGLNTEVGRRSRAITSGARDLMVNSDLFQLAVQYSKV
jgi:hypothetical protein